ncbi:MAG: hypothetical protein HGA25_00630 [Clostridiales bacterium]|nr:hypothetical protein [Clostridiales bacterium]
MFQDALLALESISNPEERRKVCVVEAIRTIEGLMDRGGEDVDLLMESASEYGRMILDALPKEVYRFVYSEELSCINAARDNGTDTWNREQAMAWALEG